jgi:hypothetical protein
VERMSLADEIEAQLSTTLDKLIDAVGAEPGPDRGLAWGDATRARIVIPLDVVAKIAASVAEEQIHAAYKNGWADGVVAPRPDVD